MSDENPGDGGGTGPSGLPGKPCAKAGFGKGAAIDGLAPWTRPEDLRARLRKDWDSGRLPATLLEWSQESGATVDTALAGASAPFPLRIALKGPTSTELGGSFEASRNWIAGLVAGESSPGYRLEWREVRHQQLGRNSVPVAAVFELPDDVLRFAGRQREGARLFGLASAILRDFPRLRPWVLRHPLVILDHDEDWPAILGSLAWFRDHPRSGFYARQIDATGVHSKFVEGHRGLLGELLDLILDAGAIDQSATGASGFNRRFGLADKTQLARFRSLDPDLGFTLTLGASGAHCQAAASIAQLSIPAEDFALLFQTADRPPFSEIFITENEINFLAFPARKASGIIFGGGYGFGYLAEAAWLRRCRLRYWGDLDTHGFAILDQFRALFPDSESFLMDRATLLAHRELWTMEGRPTSARLSRLTEDEGALYDALRANLLAPSLRLEQERIRFGWLVAALDRD